MLQYKKRKNGNTDESKTQKIHIKICISVNCKYNMQKW